MRKSVRSYTLTPTAIEAVESISNATGLDLSTVVDGAVLALWSVIQSQGFRKYPSVIESLRLTAAVKSGFYINGEQVGEET